MPSADKTPELDLGDRIDRLMPLLLRFDRPTSEAFRKAQDVSYRWPRALFFGVCCLSWLIAPWLNGPLFQASAEVIPYLLWIELAWAAPVIGAVAVIPLLTRDTRINYPLNVAGTLTAWGAALSLHSLAQFGQMDYPIHLVNACVMAVAFFGGFRFALMLPGSTITMLLGVLAVWLGEQSRNALGLYLYETFYFWLIGTGGLISIELLNRAGFRYRQHIEDMAQTDRLTGLMNRRAFERLYERAIRLAAREKKRIGVAMIDLDHFKKLNDQHGHAAGDEALRRTGAVLENRPYGNRPLDLCARYGGEEFVALWYDIRPGMEKMMADSLLGILRDIQFPAPGTDQMLKLTASIGIATGIPDGPDSGTAALKLADDALYEAKHQGRNRAVIRVMPGEPEPASPA